MKRNLVNYNKSRDVGSEGAGGAYAPSDPQAFRNPCEGLWKLCYFWKNVTLLWVPSLLELGLVLGKITLVLVGVNTHGQSSHQVLDRRSPNYPQLSDHYLNCTTEKDLTRRPEWTLFEQAVFSQLISTTILKFRQVKFHMWYPLDRRFHPSMVCKTSKIIQPLP